MRWYLADVNAASAACGSSFGGNIPQLLHTSWFMDDYGAFQRMLNSSNCDCHTERFSWWCEWILHSRSCAYKWRYRIRGKLNQVIFYTSGNLLYQIVAPFCSQLHCLLSYILNLTIVSAPLLRPQVVVLIHRCIMTASVPESSAMVAEWLRRPAIIQSGHYLRCARIRRIWLLESFVWFSSYRLLYWPLNEWTVHLLFTTQLVSMEHILLRIPYHVHLT